MRFHISVVGLHHTGGGRIGGEGQVAEHDEDAALLRELLNGRSPRLRREYRPRGTEAKTYTAVTDPSLLDPYERLFYDEDPSRSKEALAVCSFCWSEVFTYEEAVAWYEVGATYNDFHTCKALAAVGVTPELACRPYSRNGYRTGLNVFGAVVSGALSVEKVHAWKERVDVARRRSG